MKHSVHFERGHDCVRFECVHNSAACKPGSGGSHGRTGLTIRFVSQGDAGAVQFVLGTGWLPKCVKVSDIRVRNVRKWGDTDALPMDLGYHSKTPRYDGHTPTQDSCEYCGGQPCYYDGSGLNANDAMYALVNGGDDALWVFLDAYYDCVFNGAKYPAPAEYPASLRQKGNES